MGHFAERPDDRPNENRSPQTVDLEGATNTRDIGGWTASGWAAGGEPASGTRRVRTGALYRSGRLSDLTDDDLDELAGRGLRCVVDFRADDEVRRDPSRLPPTVVSVVRIPMADRHQNHQSQLERIKSGDITRVTTDELTALYIGMLDDHAERFAEFAAVAADVDNWPLLFHCTAGKDRTGIATALLLTAVGVAHDDVLDEYDLTNSQHSKRRLREVRPELLAAGVDIDAVMPLLVAPREVLAGALSYLDDSFGGAASYLVHAGGLEPAVVEMLRVNLLV